LTTKSAFPTFDRFLLLVLLACMIGGAPTPSHPAPAERILGYAMTTGRHIHHDEPAVSLLPLLGNLGSLPNVR
jgi:hypothetical protein